jgi:cell division protein FtsB
MASARHAPARAGHRPARARGKARPRLLAGGAARAAGIRWDRVSRVGLLVVLLGIVALYAGPARSYVSSLREAEQRRGEVAKLRRENERLRARRAELRNPAALEREARRMGMVRAGERPYVIENLPSGP